MEVTPLSVIILMATGLLAGAINTLAGGGSNLTLPALMVIRPSVMALPPGTVARKVRKTPGGWIGLAIAGFYGGFVQAGVGFILLAALAGTLRYDLVRANALKLACSLAFTAIALVVFIARGQVAWIPALILSAGYIPGAHLAVKFAIVAKPQTLKRLLLVMTVCGCAAVLVF